MHALVIDDTATTRRIIAALLREIGFSVTEAADGRQGLERLSSMPRPQVVLVDWNMPELDGLGFVRAVRGDRAYDGVRLVMVTTQVEMDAVVTALAAGADEYVMKPFSREMIVEKLAMLGLPPASATWD